MNIVILDGEILNPGDLSWDLLASLGTLTVYDRTSNQELMARAQDADVLLTNKIPLRAETLAKLPKLKYIGMFSTGYDRGAPRPSDRWMGKLRVSVRPAIAGHSPPSPWSAIADHGEGGEVFYATFNCVT